MSWEGLNPPYRTIVADPPWAYDSVNPPNPGLAGHIGRPAEASGLSYGSMTLEELAYLRVDQLAADGSGTWLFLWTTNRYLFDAPDLMRSWGFEPLRRIFVWCKPPMGTLTVTTEFFLVGKRGKPPRLPWWNTTWFDWPRPHHAHSVKPAAFGDLVESWCPGPYVELFARQPRLGWDHWGYGIESSKESA